MPKTQLDKFKDKAKELCCNPSEAEFEETLRKLAKAPPQPMPKKPQKTKKNQTNK